MLLGSYKLASQLKFWDFGLGTKSTTIEVVYGGKEYHQAHRKRWKRQLRPNYKLTILSASDLVGF